MNAVAVDVIVPVYNGEKYLATALASIQRQTFPVARIIVVDDGSIDETAQVIASFTRSDDRIHHLSLSHRGVSASRNAGIAASSAPFVAFLDADDVWLPDKLERQIDVFARGGSKTGLVHSSYFCIDARDQHLIDQLVVPPRLRGDIFMPLLLDGYVLSGSASSVVVRREVLDEAGYFDEQLFYGEDWDLWLRLARVCEVDFTPEALVGIRVHGQSAQRRIRPKRALEFFQQNLLVYAKWEALIQASPRLRMVLRDRAVDAVLPVLRTPSEAIAFYTSLKTSETPLTRSIFRHALDFWLQVGCRVSGILWRRLRREVVLHERRP